MSSYNRYAGDTFDHVEDKLLRAFLTAPAVTLDDCAWAFDRMWDLFEADKDNEDVTDEMLGARGVALDDMRDAMADGLTTLARECARSFFRV